MATLSSVSSSGTVPSPGHHVPSPSPETSSSSTSDPVTKDPPDAPSTAESIRSSEPGGEHLESGRDLAPPKEIGEPRHEPGCGPIPPKDLGVAKEVKGILPLDLSNHLLFSAGGQAYLLANLPLSGGSELLLPKGFPWDEASVKEEPSLPLLAHFPSSHLTTLHIQHGFDPVQGFSSSDQILSHDTSAPSLAACEGRDGSFWSYQLVPNPTEDPKDGPMGSRRGDHRAMFWICLLCRLGFGRLQAFIGHTLSHGVKLTPAHHQGLLGSPAVLQEGHDGGMAFLSFLEPKLLTHPSPEVPDTSTVTVKTNGAQAEDDPPEADVQALVLPGEEVMALSPPSPPTALATWDPSPTQAKESPVSRGEAGPDWFPEGQEEDGGLCLPLNQSSPTSKEVAVLPAPAGSPEDTSDPPQSCRLTDDYTPAPAAFQGLSLSSHMSLLHSRNSCKTLKCPKCNWHYKYQQTLDVHMREKHPESNSHCSYCSAGGAHPRLARGESYNCGYKPYRCDVCNYSTTTKGNLSIHMQSDKHLANLQGFQAGPGGQASPPEASLPPPSIGEKEPKTKSSWQCKVCSYETNISRNLRIHMTSEKHMQNVLMLHQGLPLGLPPGLVGPGPPPPPGAAPTNPPELFQYFGPQALGQPQTSMPGPGLRPDKPLEAQLLLNGFHHLGAPARKFPTAAPGSLSPETHLPPSQLLGSSSDGLSTSPSPDDSPPLKVFRCLVCQAFSTDSLELLLYHCSIGRTLPEAEWKEVAGDTHRCKLCCYGTQLKANFQLHLKTDKHTQKYQLAAHLREGGGAMGSPSPLSLGDGTSYGGSVSPLHLRCNICDFESNSKEKMQLHARGSAHEENSQIYKFLLEMEGAEAGPEPGLYHCLLCAWDTPSRLAVLQHLRMPAHRDAQAQRRLQLLQSGPAAEEGLSALQSILSFSRGRLQTPGKAPDTPLAQPPTSEKDAQNRTEQRASEVTEDRTGPPRDSANQITVFCCPYCSFLSPECDQVRVHTLSQHAVQPKYRCPLCQEQLVGRPALHFHLSHLHNVVPECVEKLLLVATTVEMTFATKMLPGPTLNPVEDGLERPAPGPEPTPNRDQVADSSNLAPEASPDPPPPPEPPLAPVEGPMEPSESPQQPPSPASSPVPRPDAQVEELTPLPTMSEEEEGVMGEPRSAEPSPADSRHLTYRKTTNFALDKFLDPARPYKCTVCKESFTQKNILLVHYNSVSHLHKMKKAAIDPSCPARGEAGIPPPTTTASDKPFKCTVCRVSYNQSSTLEIHMRSVLHQTRSRGAKTDARTEGPERSQEELKEGETEGEVGTEKKGPDPSGFMSGLPFLSPPPPPLDLHRFPAPLFTPPVLPPFPLVPESLLKLQQQQLLLPFYLHDLKVGPKLALASPTPMLSLPAANPPPLPAPPKAELAEQEWERPLIAEEGTEAGPSSPPHSSPNEAARTAAKALLENFGFELVIQYNEGKQAVPPPPTPPPPESLGGGDKLACGACGKLFSNMLILKTHEEHVHRRFLPFEALSRYAAQFRKSYDSLYPPPVEPPKPPDGSLESPPQLGPPFVVPEPEVGGIHTSEERGLAGGPWPSEEEEGSRGSVVPVGRRFSRTKFTEFQTQALQSFFETSAYPKDGEVERLASLLGLASRVVVVWFQNARQKARKNACEGGPMTAGGATGGASGCRRCHATFACVFELVRHLKKCFDDQPPAEEEEAERGEEEEEVEEEEVEERNPEPAGRHGDRSPERANAEDVGQAEPTRPESKETEGKAPPSPPAHTCDQCSISFPSQDLLTTHHQLHFLPSVQPSASSQLLDLPLLVFGERNPVVSGPSSVTGTPLKRKHDDGSLSPTGSEAGGGGEGEPPKDKRLRTTILPEQLEILYRWYMQDSNPTRKMLDCISEEVGLKKRVVQVWFQNTRARERKGQFRSTPGGVAGPAAKPTATPSPAPFPKFNLLLSKIEDETGKEAPKREAPAFPYPTVTPAAAPGPLPFLAPGKEVTAPTPEPPPPLPPSALSEDEGPEEPSKASPESEACSPSAGDLSDSSASSLAEPESPGAGGNGGGPGSGPGVPDGMGQRRYRTQMSSLQLKIMKACYEAYRTPTMQECEVLGEEIGLPKRVIQVWFQNARAKEKKAKLQGTAPAGSGGGSEGPSAAQRTDCPYCDVKYDFYVSCRGHLFSRQHLAKLKEAVRAQLKSESKCYDLAPAPETPLAPKGPPATTPASVPLGASPTLPRLAPVLLPGPTLAQPPLGSIASFNSGPAASSGLLGLATSVLPATTVVQTAGPGRPLPQRPVSNQTNSSTDPSPGPATEPSGDKVSGERKPVATLTNSSTDALKNLKALKATVPALLGGQFLPFPLPPAGGAAPPAVFGPQLQGSYFQQLYGMKKGLFPMNPVIPQTLIGLLPNALLQQPPQAPEPTATAPPKPPELPAPGEGESSEADELLTGSAGISTVDVTHRYLCRQCKMAFDGEAPATAHQRSFCFFGRGSGGSMPAPLRVPICTYHCLACEVLLSGREALASHLRSSAHRRKAAPPPGGPPITVTNSATAVPAAVAFAKEEARLPHTDPNPQTTTTSTLLAL